MMSDIEWMLQRFDIQNKSELQGILYVVMSTAPSCPLFTELSTASMENERMSHVHAGSSPEKKKEATGTPVTTVAVLAQDKRGRFMSTSSWASSQATCYSCIAVVNVL